MKEELQSCIDQLDAIAIKIFTHDGHPTLNTNLENAAHRFCRVAAYLIEAQFGPEDQKLDKLKSALKYMSEAQIAMDLELQMILTEHLDLQALINTIEKTEES